MRELFRDTAFGHIIRFVTKRKYLKYPEEADPSDWTKYIDEKKSGYLAHHGKTEEPKEGTLKLENLGRVRTPDHPFKLAPPQDAPQRPSEDTKMDEKDEDSKPPTPSRMTSDDSNLRQVNQASGVAVDPEKGRDIHLVTWYGDDDPDNPQNWSRWKKIFVTANICLLTTSVYIGSSIYAPGTQSIMETFGVGKVPATLGLTMFVLGYGTGPMLWSPMSEVPQIGRSPIYLGTLAVFVALQAPTAMAPSFGVLLFLRFLTGFFGSPVLATGGATLADIWSPRKRAYAISIWGIAAVSGPALGPLVGGFAVEYGGTNGVIKANWSWPLWELMWMSAFCLVFLFFMLPETSAANILHRRTRRLRKLTGDDKLMCEPDLQGEEMTGREIASMVLVRPFTLNFYEPMVFLLNLYIALIYGLLYAWFESFVLVFVNIYGFKLGEEGLSYLGLFIGALVVIPPYFWYMHKYLEPRFNENGEIQPELRLEACFVGAFCIPICLFWFGWASRPDVHWIVPIIGSSFFSIGAFLLFNGVLSYLGDAYPMYAASVLAGNDLMRSSVGAGFPLFAGAMYEKLGIAWASSTLAFISIAFIPIPFVLYKFGPLLRKKYSRYARKDL